MDQDKLLHAGVTDGILKAFYHVYNTLFLRVPFRASS
jgi:hypothetical protein